MKPLDKSRIAIVHTDIGRNPTPDDVDTLIQAQFIREGLEACGYNAPLLPFRPGTLASDLQKFKAHAIFNLVEAVGGEDERAGEAAFFFEQMGLPYTGNSARTLQALICKPTVKRQLQRAGLPTPAFAEDGSQGRQWILKSETFHCSRGIDKRNVSDNLNFLQQLSHEYAARYSGAWFIEEYIPGREINIALLDNGTSDPDVLPASEICFSGQEPHIVDYDSKWNEGSESYNNTTPSVCFAETDQPLLQELAHLSRACWHEFSLGGYARVDFRIDHNNQPFILEINANPCLSPDAGFMRAATQAGLDSSALIARLISPLLPAQKSQHAQVFG